MTTDTREALAPCPFCGGKAEVERVGSARQSTIYRCTNCSCSLETGEVFNIGEHWNHREPLHAPSPERATGTRENELRVVDIARDLVAMWQNPKIVGLPRSERNAAIESLREELTVAVDQLLVHSSTGSEQGNSTSEVAGSSPAAPANNATVAQLAERPFCKGKVAGSTPAGGTKFLQGHFNDQYEAGVRPEGSPSDTPSVAGTEREAVARIIDPELYAKFDKERAKGTLAANGRNWADVCFGPAIRAVEIKADAILARRENSRTVAETGEPVEREVSELVAYFRPGRIDQGVASRGEIIDEMASLIRRDTGILNGCADAAARSIAEMLTRAALAQPATAGEP